MTDCYEFAFGLWAVEKAGGRAGGRGEKGGVLKMKKPESPARGFWRGAGGSNSSKGEFIQTERILSAMFIYSRN